MSVTRSIWSIVVVSCLAIIPHAKAALEKAAGKASTSVGLAHTSANAWALETDPAVSVAQDEGAPPVQDYYFLNGSLSNTYDASQFTLVTDPNGYPTLQSSVSGLGGFQVTSFVVDYFANPAEGPDDYANGYPSITVTASSLKFTPDAAGNLPDISLPVGEVDDITFSLLSDAPLNSADDGPPNVTMDQYFFQLNLQGAPDAIITDSANTAFAGPSDMITAYDPDLNPDSPYYLLVVNSPDIAPSEVPEPASLSLLGIAAVGLVRRRRSR